MFYVSFDERLCSRMLRTTSGESGQDVIQRGVTRFESGQNEGVYLN